MRAAVLLALAVGCTHPPAPAATTSGAGVDRDDDPPLEPAFAGPKGRCTKLELRLANEISQHLIGAWGDKSHVYVESVSGAPRDFVAFFATKPACDRFRVVGTVVEVSGPAKGKATGTVTELELDVERWWCLGT